MSCWWQTQTAQPNTEMHINILRVQMKTSLIFLLLFFWIRQFKCLIFLPKSLCSFYYYFLFFPPFLKKALGPHFLIRHSKIAKAGHITNDESRIQNENRANWSANSMTIQCDTQWQHTLLPNSSRTNNKQRTVRNNYTIYYAQNK